MPTPSDLFNHGETRESKFYSSSELIEEMGVMISSIHNWEMMHPGTRYFVQFNGHAWGWRILPTEDTEVSLK